MQRLIALLFAAGAVSPALAAAQTKPGTEVPNKALTVCDVLSAPLKYDGRMVKIRGRMSGTDEGQWLVGDDCPGVVVTEGHVWSSSIALEPPTINPALRLHPVDFKYDLDWEFITEGKARELRRSLPDRCMVFTYTGMFETRADWHSAKHVYPNGTFMYMGFGHLGESPGQLLLKSEDDVKAVPGCSDKDQPLEAMPKK
jgi:hypothetical protein